MGQARRNPMSAQGKKGAARDAARLRQHLRGVRTPGELRYFVSQIAEPEHRAEVWRVCWPLSPLGEAGPAPEWGGGEA